MVLLCANALSVTTSSSPPWPVAQTSGTPFSGGESCPSTLTMRMRPGRSVTSILLSGRNASAHGWTKPPATVCTSSCPAEDANVVSSPRVLVAIRKVTASRVAAASAAVTSPTGVFTMVRSRCHAPRVIFGKSYQSKRWELRRDRHRQGDLDRQHCEGDDEAQRQRAEPERGGDGVGQPGRSNGRGASLEAGRAGRPYHGLNPSGRGRITPRRWPM